MPARNWLSFLLLAVVSLVTAVDAADQADKLKRMKDGGTERRQERLQKLERIVALLENDLPKIRQATIDPAGPEINGAGKTRTYVFVTQTIKDRTITEAEQSLTEARSALRELQARTYLGPNVDVTRMSVGDAGIIVDAKWKNPLSVRVLQVIDAHSTFIQSDQGDIVCLKIDTAELAPGKHLTLTKELEVTGTRVYRDSNSTEKKVFELEPCQLAEK